MALVHHGDIRTVNAVVGSPEHCPRTNGRTGAYVDEAIVSPHMHIGGYGSSLVHDKTTVLGRQDTVSAYAHPIAKAHVAKPHKLDTSGNAHTAHGSEKWLQTCIAQGNAHGRGYPAKAGYPQLQ